jgi:hypothetical protein
MSEWEFVGALAMAYVVGFIVTSYLVHRLEVEPLLGLDPHESLQEYRLHCAMGWPFFLIGRVLVITIFSAEWCLSRMNRGIAALARLGRRRA